MKSGEMRIELTNKLVLHVPPGSLLADVIDRLTFDNPKWLENDRHGRWQGDTPKTLKFYERVNGSLIIPRGFIRQLIFLSRQHGVAFQVNDRRHTLPDVDFQFQGQLRPFQEEAVKDVLSHDFGTLTIPTGGGKTVCALHVIAYRKQPVLVIVHTKELAFQWRERACQFLDIKSDEIGLIGGWEKDCGGSVNHRYCQQRLQTGRRVTKAHRFFDLR